MKSSILKLLQAAFLGFGLFMGIVFPFFAELFVTVDEGMFGVFFTACLFAGVSIGVFNYILLNKILISRLRRISEVANAISQQDLTHTCKMQSEDVIGEIINSFNSMAAKLRQMIGEIQTHSRSMFDSVNRLNEVSQKAQQGSDQQFSEIQAVQQSIAELSESSQVVSSQTNEAVNITQQTNNSAQSGETKVKRSIEVITQLSDGIQDAAGAITRLQGQTEVIGSVLDVIHGISEQTNLLALNAAIEAARAGEQGRGFAVVADEVRSLAARTQESTHEIQSMIEALQSEAKQAVTMMEKSKDEVSKGVAEVIATGEVLSEITGAVSSLAQMNDAMSSAAERQQGITAHINQNIEILSSIATDSQSGSQEASSESQLLADETEKLHSMVESFKL